LGCLIRPQSSVCFFARFQRKLGRLAEPNIRYIIGAYVDACICFNSEYLGTAVNHAVWNLTIVTTGLPLTGLQNWRGSAPLQSNFTGPDWWTGGVAGPESSVLVIVFVVLIDLTLLYVVLRKQHT